MLQALGGCDRRCGSGCDRLGGGFAVVDGVPRSSGGLESAVSWRLSGAMESAISVGCLAALLLMRCSGGGVSCLDICYYSFLPAFKGFCESCLVCLEESSITMG